MAEYGARTQLLACRPPRLIVPTCLPGGSEMPLSALAGSLSNRAANEALHVPFEVDEAVDASGLNWVVDTQNGNYDVGIYTYGGILIASKGTTAVPAAGLATGTFSATVRLSRGKYFASIVWSNNGTLRFYGFNGVEGEIRSVACFQTAAAGPPLPASLSFTDVAWTTMPLLSLELV